MALSIWTGAVDSAWSTNGNWTAGKPGAGDVGIIQGSVDIDGSDESADTPDAVVVGRDYIGQIATGANKLIFGILDRLDYFSAGPAAYIDASRVEKVILDTPNMTTGLVLGGDPGDALTEWNPSAIYAMRGRMYLGDAPQSVYISHRLSRRSDVSLELKGGPLTGHINQAGGKLSVTESLGGTVYLAGGELDLNVAVTDALDLFLYSGLATAPSVASIRGQIFGGSLYTSEESLTAATSDIVIHESADVNIVKHGDGSTPSLSTIDVGITAPGLTLAPRGMDYG